eukprot:157523-Amphidinium_carterae.1
MLRKSLLASASAQPAQPAAKTRQRSQDQLIAAWAMLMKKVYYLERFVWQIKRATFVIPAATLRQATEIFLPAKLPALRSTHA